ncbi:P-loop NTPase family protein [Spirosoma soli]|uniref:adenylate kinase n=1 Tax=Spirosoma soli TaxID=1770529 RepID=UPI0036D2800E
MNVLYYDTDSYHWVPTYPAFTIKRPADERHQWLISDLAKQNRWILGGTVYNWGTYWQSAFDLAVYLWIPAEIRLQRLKQREKARGVLQGKALNQSQQFLEWAAHYDTNDLPGRNRSRHEQWMLRLTCPVLRIEGDTTLPKRLQLVLDALNKM